MALILELIFIVLLAGSLIAIAKYPNTCLFGLSDKQLIPLSPQEEEKFELKKKVTDSRFDFQTENSWGKRNG